MHSYEMVCLSCSLRLDYVDYATSVACMFCDADCQDNFFTALNKHVDALGMSFPNIGKATPSEMCNIYVRGLNWEDVTLPFEDAVDNIRS